jgi:hypothetical protein
MNLEQKYKEAETLAEEELIRLIRAALKKPKNKNVSHAVLAMGRFFFVGDYAEYGTSAVLYEQEEEIAPQACKFLNRWDDIFKLTGWGVKIYRSKIEQNF